MDIDFQDRIDEYLLRADALSDEEKARFLHEIETDAEKKEQYELTKKIKDAVTSHEDKRKLMAELQKERRAPHGYGKVVLWVTGIAAVLVAGFFCIRPATEDPSPDGPVRGDDSIFEQTLPADTADTVSNGKRTDTYENTSLYPGNGGGAAAVCTDGLCAGQSVQPAGQPI